MEARHDLHYRCGSYQGSYICFVCGCVGYSAELPVYNESLSPKIIFV